MMVVRQSGDRRFQRLLGAEAEQHGVAVMGTLRVLELAAEHGLIDLPTAITQFEATSFYLPWALVEAMLAHDAARKSRPSD